MNKLFAVVIKDHIGSVISALGETELCHFIEKPRPTSDLSHKISLLASVERRVDEILFNLPKGNFKMNHINVSSDIDIMLFELAKDVLNIETLTHNSLINIKKKLIYLKKIYNIIGNCEETKFIYIFEAWIPTINEELLKNTIENASNGQCVVEFYKPDFAEIPPTLLSNPTMMKPFESLVKMYGLPSYYEIDPTAIIFITFPLIFGMMYGDVGHGIILLLLSYGLYMSEKRGYKTLLKFKSLFPILMSCSIFSIIFGALYGEFFGTKFTPLWLDPVENVAFFLMFSLFVGILHLILGFILNAINFWKNKKYHRSVFQIQWIIFSLSSVYFIINSIIIGVIDSMSFLILFLFPAINMINGAIITNNVERKSTLSGITATLYLGLEYLLHLVSYMRLLIMALVHSTVSATIVSLSGNSAISLIFAAIITFILLIVVETFVVFIQTLRIHWVEWFYLFFKGKGIKYSPFKK